MWSSFVELDKLIPNICRVSSEKNQLMSYDLKKYSEKPAEKPAVKTPCLNFLKLILGRFSQFFFKRIYSLSWFLIYALLKASIEF
jgi:hypothetical protein